MDLFCHNHSKNIKKKMFKSGCTEIEIYGKEHTTVHEETNVQEDDAPDELRESMQDIINQFMDQPVQQEKQATSHETEI
jgi:hypothetical protein